MATAIGYGLVVVIVLGLLWTRGALRDWYLQTIVFPKTLYVGDGTSFLITFARLQLRQPIYWLAIRAVVVVGAATQFASRRDSDALLMASITAFLWIAAFPSANFMHQWWTVSLAIPPFVLYVHDTIGLIVKRRQPLTAVVTAALVSLLVVGAVRERLTEGDFRMAALSETIREPAVFRGIRTDAPTKRAFDLFYQMISRYESHHPGTAIVSINSEGRPDGIPIDESLVLLSFIEKNPHPLPVYWSVPVLTTTIYPEYYNVVWNEIRRQHPLIVEYRDAGYKPAAIKDYTVLIGAQADFGYWYLYAPEHTTRAEHEELSVFLARDGSLESGLSVSGADPTRTSGLDPNPVGASRGTVQTSNGPVTLYTWPADLPVKGSEFAIDPLPEPLGHTSIVKKTASGGWEVEGQAEGKYSYLIQFVDAPLERNATLVARGELYEGGFQMGFIRQNQWSGSVVVTEPGTFEAVLVIQKSAKYTVEIANCLQSTSSLSAARRHWLRGTLGAFTGDFLPNHFRISQLGWARLRN